MRFFILNLFLLLAFSAYVKADTVDNYQIYINKILVRNDSGFPEKYKSKSYISLNKSLCGVSLELHFHHCTGYEGKRRVTVVDRNYKILKEFEFTTSDYDAEINIPISFFCEDPLIKSHTSYSLIYYDSAVKEGRFLTDIQIKK